MELTPSDSGAEKNNIPPVEPQISTEKDGTTLNLWQKLKSLSSAGKEDFRYTDRLDRAILIGALAMIGYEWGPGNETATPLVTGPVLDAANGPGGIALTALVAGGFVAGQQLMAGFLARRTANQFPSVTEKAYGYLNNEGESDSERFRSFKKLSLWKKIGYSVFLGSSFNVIREVVAADNNDESDLKRINRTSAAISGSTIALVGAGTDLVNQAFENNQAVQLCIDYGVKNPLLWLGIMGAKLYADHSAAQKASAKTTQSY